MPTRVQKPSPPPSRSKPLIPNWLITLVVLFVMLMWGGSIVWSTTHPDWPIPPSIHAVVVAVVTGLMGYLAMKGKANGNG